MAHEQKYDLDQALKKTKTNEKLVFTEMDHLRNQLDKAETELAQFKKQVKADDSAKKLSEVSLINIKFYFCLII